MFEKANPSHPDKLADRIAGALVDMAYRRRYDPRIAVEVLIGHSVCHIIAETSVRLDFEEIGHAVGRIAGDSHRVIYDEHPQDPILAENQQGKIRCGDNGIFKGCPITEEQRRLSNLMKRLYQSHPYDGKALICDGKLTLCQSNARSDCLAEELRGHEHFVVNPLGEWDGGTSVDCGATNRKLGSDMGDAVTGGGLHGKDLSKADVSVAVYAHVLAQQLGEPCELCCSIGDEFVDGTPYGRVVEIAREFVEKRGGFEKLAEWGLV